MTATPPKRALRGCVSVLQRLHPLQDAVFFLDAGNTADLFGGQTGRGNCEAADIVQVAFRQFCNGLAQFQQTGQGAAAEDITGTGGIDGTDLGAGNGTGGVFRLQQTTLGAQSDPGQGYTELVQPLFMVNCSSITLY